MFCPKCGAEYRPGYTVCADCHVFLAAERPQRRRAASAWPPKGDGEDAADQPLAESEDVYRGGETPEPGDPSEDPFCSFWKGNDARVCAELCTVLDEAGIPHKTVHRRDHLFNLNNQAGYELGVPASLYEKAELTVKEAFGTDAETGEDAVPLLPAPDREPAEFEKGLRDAIADANEWLGPRYPEDATLEVWSGEDVDTKEMIEMSLRENDVLNRSEEEKGLHKVFVLPDHAARAKEIVREVIEGTPMD
jgi:hypothetical protein